MRKMILLNAPAKSGKDVVIKHLQEKGIPLQYAECKDKLHNLVQEIFNIDDDHYWEIYNDRNLKEARLDEFKVVMTLRDYISLSGYCNAEGIVSNIVNHDKIITKLSIRQAMIYVSEVIIKPRFGSDYFGKARMSKMNHDGVYVDGSAAFVDEIDPLINELGQENILLIRVHREGYTFDGDSRSYIPDGIIDNTVDVDNNGTEQEYFDKVESIVKEFLDD